MYTRAHPHYTFEWSGAKSSNIRDYFIPKFRTSCPICMVIYSRFIILSFKHINYLMQKQNRFPDLKSDTPFKSL